MKSVPAHYEKINLITLLAIWTSAVKAQSSAADQGVILLKPFYSAYITLFSGESGNMEANEKKLTALKQNYLQYDMMGYFGTYDCRFGDQNFRINGKTGDGQLRKQDGLVNLNL